MAAGPLGGARVLVVGASSGVGRAVARHAIESGADVVVAARRQAALDDLVAEAGAGTSVAVDITDADSCRELAAFAAATLGVIDLVVNASGVSVLHPVEDTDPSEWRRSFDTNVVGTNLLLSALLPHLGAGAYVGVVSTENVERARAGLAAYLASKAALESCLRSWCHEHAPRRFGCIAIGATMPTEVSDGFDPDLLTAVLGDWMNAGQMQTGTMATEEVGAAIVELLAVARRYPDIGFEHVRLRSPAPLVGTVAAVRAERGA